MIRKLFSAIVGQKHTDRWVEEYRGLIHQEAVIGGTMFGPVPEGGRREFFCLDRNTWIWHEEWLDKSGRRCAVTTRYDVRPDGVFWARDGQPYQRLVGIQASHFYQAVRLYDKRVKAELYGVPA